MSEVDGMTLRQYLKHVYPLANNDISNSSVEELQVFFNALDFYYQLKPQPSGLVPIGNIIPRNTRLMPEVGDLCAPSIINPDGFWCRNIYPSAQPLNNPLAEGYGNSSDVEICHSNVYDGSLGVYYYAAAGTGIYVNIGKTLAANNKLDALRKLGMSNAQIASSLNTDGTGYWPAYYEGTLPPSSSKQFFKTLVQQHIQRSGGSVAEAESYIIDCAINETDYLLGRLNDTGWQVDVDNFTLGRQQGYDTIQLTTQANMNNGWAFEIIDLRVQSGAALNITMADLGQYYTIRNPFNLEQQKPVVNRWPYYNLYSENSMSEMTKYYASYDGRFDFSGPGYFTPIASPSYPA